MPANPLLRWHPKKWVSSEENLAKGQYFIIDLSPSVAVRFKSLFFERLVET